MKKILFATTALVATAGIASAQDLGVAITGNAELGIFKNENRSGDATALTTDVSETQVFTDIDVFFTMSGEADNGLTFGAVIDLDEATGADQSDAARMPDATIFMSFAGLTLTVGDTDSAFDARLTETAIGGAINDDHTVHPGYSGNSGFDESDGGQEIRLDYAYDAFVFSLSTSPAPTKNFDPSYAIGVSYTTSLAGLDLGVGLGYITTDENSLAGPATYDNALGLSLSTTFDNGLQAIVNYSHLTDDSSPSLDSGSHWGIGLGYTMNALTIGANYGEYDLDAAGEASGYGLTVNYDLGGGLVAQLGYGGGDPVAGTYEDTYSLGVSMSF